MKIINKLLEKRKQNKFLNYQDFFILVKKYSNDQISDKEMTPFLKNVFEKKLTCKEILIWFDAIVDNSKIVYPSFKIKKVIIDKHSTGGVGDKITIILLPLLASLGFKVIKLSGKFLGHTGGTITKLNSFKGINLKVSRKILNEKIKKENIAFGEIESDFSNFEKKFYLLRTKTKTTKSTGLIFLSILIKKILIKTEILLIDLKIGSGSLFKKVADIEEFIYLIKKITKKYNRKLLILSTNMDQPLGVSVGNKNEVLEVIKALEGEGIASDLKEIILEMASQLLIISSMEKDILIAKKKVLKKLETREALKEFKKWIENSGGDFDSIYKNQKINTKYKIEIKAKNSGFIVITNNSKIGDFLNEINNVFDGEIDYEAGMNWYRKTNSEVKKNDIVFVFYTNKENINELKKRANNLFVISSNKVFINKNILKVNIF